MRRMLINAQREEELRVAIITGKTLDDYQIAVATAGLTRGNIYRGTVASIHTGLDAAFVDYGAPRHGLLARHDVVAAAMHRQSGDPGKPARIEKVLDRGKSLLVQVTREPVGAKGSALTTNLSLAGRYLVFMPFDPSRGISRKVEDEGTRSKLKEIVASLDIPEGCGVIARTNAIDQNKTALNRDLTALLRLWKKIKRDGATGKGPTLLYSDQDLIVQAVRDWLDSSIDEVIVDDAAAYEKAKSVLHTFLPRTKIKLDLYRERMPLFSRFELEEQIERIFKPRVELASGASIVVESTEALTAIDVNSGRSQRGTNEEDTATKTNLEAAMEVARQLRLRDIGGLIVVDFIDMRASKHRHQVEKAMRDALKTDRARTTVGRISPNGLLEINRQRIRSPLVLRTHRECPTCGGMGKIPSPETVSVSLLRRIEERAAVGGVAAVKISLHPELADAFQNHYRRELAALEQEFGIRIEVIAATSMHRSDEGVSWEEGEPVRRPVTPSPAPQGPLGSEDDEDIGEEREDDGESGSDAPAPEGTAPSRSKRRRRGGRRHRRRTGGGEGSAATDQGEDDRDEDSSLQESAGRDTGHDAPDSHPVPTKTPSGRKRRRRRRSAGTDTDASRQEPSQPEAPTGPPSAAAAVGGGGEHTDPSAAPEGTPKKRRRRRRRPAGERADAPATGAGEAGEGDAD